MRPIVSKGEGRDFWCNEPPSGTPPVSPKRLVGFTGLLDMVTADVADYQIMILNTDWKPEHIKLNFSKRREGTNSYQNQSISMMNRTTDLA